MGIIQIWSLSLLLALPYYTVCDPKITPKCGVKAQVFFVVDGSVGVESEANFNSMITAIKAVIANLAIDTENGFNVGLTKYGYRTADEHWADLRPEATMYNIYKYLDRVAYNAALESNLYKGLWKMNSRFIARERGPDDTLIGVVITNAPPGKPERAKHLAKKYKARGVKLITIAAGPSAPVEILKDIASDEERFLTISYTDLSKAENIQLLTDMICDLPDMCPVGGALAARDPRGCNSYTTCLSDGTSRVTSCGHLFWDNYDLSCKILHDVMMPCLIDPCREDGGYKGRYNHYPLPGTLPSCRASARCYNRRMSSVECCPGGEVPITGNLIICRRDGGCSGACMETRFAKITVCSLVPDAADVTKYIEKGEVVSCPDGTVYSSLECACVALIGQSSQTQCRPVLDLAFDSDTITDTSFIGAQITAEGVTVINGTASFTESGSCLRIPFFNNIEWSAQLRVDITFMEDPDFDQETEQALISNSGCDVQYSSFHVTYNRQNSKIQTVVDTGSKTHVDIEVEPDVLKNVSVLYDGFKSSLTLNVTENGDISSTSTTLTGNIKRVKCDLSIGCGFGLANFRGLISEVRWNASAKVSRGEGIALLH